MKIGQRIGIALFKPIYWRACRLVGLGTIQAKPMSSIENVLSHYTGMDQWRRTEFLNIIEKRYENPFSIRDLWGDSLVWFEGLSVTAIGALMFSLVENADEPVVQGAAFILGSIGIMAGFVTQASAIYNPLHNLGMRINDFPFKNGLLSVALTAMGVAQALIGRFLLYQFSDIESFIEPIIRCEGQFLILAGIFTSAAGGKKITEVLWDKLDE
ncbi:MAG: hypothetical protein ABH823_03245 [bacterium]